MSKNIENSNKINIGDGNRVNTVESGGKIGVSVLAGGNPTVMENCTINNYLSPAEQISANILPTSSILSKEIDHAITQLVNNNIDFNEPNTINAIGKLFNVIKTGNLEVLKKFIKSGIDVNLTDVDGNSLVHIAALHGHLSIIEHLKSKGADIFVTNKYLETTLHNAAKSGNVKCLKYLVKAGVDVNLQDWQEQAPIHVAAKNGYLEIIKHLVNIGANVKLLSQFGSILYLSISIETQDCAQWIIQNIDIDTHVENSNPLSFNSIDVAAQLDIVNIMKSLIDKGFDVKPSDKKKNLLQIAARSGSLLCAKFLIEKCGYYVNEKEGKFQISTLNIFKIDLEDFSFFPVKSLSNKYFCNPILEAAKGGQCNVIHYLFESGADIFVKDDQSFFKDYCALHHAAESGNNECVRYLINAGFDVNIKNAVGDSPLHCAAGKGHLNIIRILITSGANKFAQNNYGWSALHSAARLNRLNCVKFLIAVGLDVNTEDFKTSPIHLACRFGFIDLIKYLVVSGANVFANDENGSTLLHLAAESSSDVVILYLIKKGLDIHATDNNGCTAVYVAVSHDNVKTLKVLLEFGAKTKIDNLGYMLLYAVNSESLSCVKYFLESGVDINSTSRDGYTALHIAVQKNNIEILKYLVTAGADTFAKNNKGFTPLSLAIRDGKEDCENIIISCHTH